MVRPASPGGRAWPLAPDAPSLRTRWDTLLEAEGPGREALFEPSRARTPHSAVAQLPGHPAGTERLAHATGPCPEPVRVLRAPFDEQWLIPDHRLLDAARPELWRVADEHQVFVLELPPAPAPGGAAPPGGPGRLTLPLLATSLLPFPAPRTGRVRPLYRRPGGAEPNLAPGLAAHLGTRLGRTPGPSEILAWIMAAVRHGPRGHTVPLTTDPERWERGVTLGRRMLWLMRRDGERPGCPAGGGPMSARRFRRVRHTSSTRPRRRSSTSTAAASRRCRPPRGSSRWPGRGWSSPGSRPGRRSRSLAPWPRSVRPTGRRTGRPSCWNCSPC